MDSRWWSTGAADGLFIKEFHGGPQSGFYLSVSACVSSPLL